MNERCGKCQGSVGPYRIFWPLYGLICGTCRARLEEGSYLERMVVSEFITMEEAARARVFTQHTFTAVPWSCGPDKQVLVYICYECGQVRPTPPGEPRIWVEQGECPHRRALRLRGSV